MKSNTKSEALLMELLSLGVIQIKFCDLVKAKEVIRKHLCLTHKSAVEQTFMAKNKQQYNEPNFED